jgi:hypothetical protein
MSSSFNREPLSSRLKVLPANDFDSKSEQQQQQNMAVAISQKEFFSFGSKKVAAVECNCKHKHISQ